MKKTLILLLAIVVCAVSFASCVGKKDPNAKPDITESQPDNLSTPISDNSDESETLLVNSEFYNQQYIIGLQQAVFEAYKAEDDIVNVDSTLNYYMESLSFDDATKTAVVQMTCIEKGRGPKFMTFTFAKTETGWEKQKLVYTEASNNTYVVPNDDVFYREHYKAVQNTAFKFFRAYVMADYNTACSLIDSLDNPCLEYFNSKKDSLKNVADFAVQINGYEVDESGKGGTAYVDVWHDIDPSPGNEGIDYMVLTIKFKEITAPDGKTEIQYCVSDYDFDT